MISGPRAEIWARQYTDAWDSPDTFVLKKWLNLYHDWEVQDVPRPTGDINLGSKVVEEGLVVVPSGPLKVPFILIVLNDAPKEVVSWLPVFINIAVIGRTRNIRLVEVNIQNLPDAVIRNLPLFTLSKYPKIKVLFFSVCYHQVPNVS